MRTPSEGVNPLLERALGFLENVYDEDSALFPFTTRLQDGRYVSSFGGSGAIRYTINCLLGLKAAAQKEVASPKLRGST